jgi:hypothetical protein
MVRSEILCAWVEKWSPRERQPTRPVVERSLEPSASYRQE